MARAPQLLSVKAAAARMGVCPNTVYRMVAAGVLPCVDVALPGARPKTRIDESDLAALIETRKRTARRLRTA